MPRWLAVILVSLLVCIVGIVFGGRMLLGRVQDELSEPVERSIAESVEAAVLQAIRGQDASSGAVRISQFDLDINTVIGPAGESGFEVTAGSGQDQVTIYGATTTIDDLGIAVDMADIAFQAMPVVEDGRVEFEQIDFEKGVSGWILPAGAFESGFETGINDALKQSRLTPVSLSLDDGEMTIVLS
jgi:hypothetical protein